MTFEEIMINEDDADMFLLDEFDNDETEDVSLVEIQEIKPEPLQNTTTVPRGWRYKTKSRKLISPTGEVFRSRRGALKAMVNSENYSVEEIEEMRSMLRHEGWRGSDNLPRCWMIRDGRKNHNSEFLGPGGEYFTTLRKAAQFIFNYEEYFYNEDLTNFWKYANINGLKKEDFNTSYNNNKKDDEENEEGDSTFLSVNAICNVNRTNKKSLKTLPKDGFCGDPLFPSGWKIKKAHGGRYLLKQGNGKVFQGIRNALKYLIAENSSEGDIEQMRSCLKLQGFKRNNNLPHNWLFKKRSHETFYVDNKGNLHRGITEALKRIASTENLDRLREDLQVIVQTEKDRVYKNRKNWNSADTSLPKGWMSKEFLRGTVKFLKFRAPTGEVLLGRRNLLKFIVKNNFSSDLIKMTKCSLMSEGWQENDDLPSQWMYKLHEGKYGNSLQFIDVDGNLYKSKEEVKRHFQQLQNFENLSKFDQFLQSRQKGSYYKAGLGLDEEWLIGDPSVPSGWRIRKRFIGGNIPGEQLLTPDNKCLEGRRVAIKYMVNNNYPKEEVKLMRNGLITYYNWLEDPQLPENWLYRCTNNGRKSTFIDSDGNLFKSQLEVLKFYKNKDNQHIVNLLEQFFNVPVVHHVENEEGWRKNDPSVPSGWSIKDRKDGYSFLLLSPEGFFFHGRKAALKYLIQSKYPEEQIHEMRSSLTHEGWSFDNSLPHNWLYKRDKKKTIFEFVSQDATYFKTPTAAIRYLEENNLTAEKEMLEICCQQLQRNERIEDNSWSKDDSVVPPGWKTKEYKAGNSIIQKRYISPGGHVFTKRTSALKFMFDNKDTFSDGEVKNMKLLLQKHDRWYSDPQLPTDWLYKSFKAKSHNMSFLTNEAVLLRSRDIALKYLEDKNMIKDKILLQGFISSVQRNDRIEDNSWNFNDQTVPSGWKTKIKQNGKLGSVLVLISPDGQLCMGRRKALKYMIENKDLYSESEAEEMRSLLQVHDGWLADYDMPRNWLYKKERKEKDGLSFLDSSGNYYRSKEQLFVTLGKEKLDGLKNFFDRNSISCFGQDAWISNDPSLPPGWKIRKLEQQVQVPDKVKALLSSDKISSPDGHIFGGRAHAYRHMIRKNYPRADLAIMRNGLLADGWFEDSALPQNWLAKKHNKDSVKSSRFMDEKGNIYKSLVIASRFLTRQGRPEDIDKLRTFYGRKPTLKEILVPHRNSKKVKNAIGDKVPVLEQSETEDPGAKKFGWFRFKEEALSGWKYRIDKAETPGPGCYKSPSGDTVRGRLNVLKYMKEHYFEEDAVLAMKKRFRKEDGKAEKKKDLGQSKTIVKTEPNIQAKQTNGKSLKIREGGKRNSSSGWNTFPEESLVGWKYTDRPGMSGHCRYLSPDGYYLNGRLQVLKFMRENKICEETISAMKNTFRTAAKEFILKKLS